MTTDAPIVTPLDPPWREVRFFTSLDSTQAEALRRTAMGENMRGVAIQSELQTRGRGRLRHGWVSEAGGLYVTAGLPLPAAARPDATGWAPLAAALACAETIEDRLGLAAHVKWPNDILVR
ncbi:MAG: hypothetical protein M1457_06045, partial [bacterium]|nr:hypothetical protein [bacterium]